MPSEQFCHILQPLFSVRDGFRHCRQPMFKKETKRLSYKIFVEQLFREVMEEQRLVPLKFSALYRNDNEIADLAEMDVEDAIAMAKARAKKNIRDTGKPTSRSTIEIGHGEGRYTREVEFIWWPTLYSQTSGHCKLSVRCYLKKVSLQIKPDHYDRETLFTMLPKTKKCISEIIALFQKCKKSQMETTALTAQAFNSICYVPKLSLNKTSIKNIKHLMTGSEGNKIHCFPRDQSLIDLLYSKTKQKQILINALRFQQQHQVTSVHVQQRSNVNISRVTVNCFPFSQCCPLMAFGGKQFYCQM